MKKLCATTQKIIYRTRKKARKAANKYRARAAKLGGKPATNSYQCHFCGHWHLTKQEQKNNDEA